jgi:hypothetical protein
MNLLGTVATMLLAYYDCNAYGSGDYSGTCQTTSSTPATDSTSSGVTSAPATNSQMTDTPTGDSQTSSNDDKTTTTTQPPASDSSTPAQAIESTPYAILIPIILGIAILLAALFILIRRMMRRS